MSKRNTYLEETRISEVRRLAIALGLTTEQLLQASLCLSENFADLNVEGCGDLTEIHDANVSLSA